jgi:competence protein ComEA
MDSSLPRPAPPRSPLDRLREWVVWFGPGRLVATGFAVVAVVIGGTWLLKGSPSRAEDVLPFATRPTSTSTTAVAAVGPSTTLATSIVVYVAGQVTTPGIYTVPGTARVNDAVLAAGGPRTTADLGVVNLAAPLHDGERVYVPASGEAVPPLIEAAPEATGSLPVEPVNINAASAAQLDVLPGVGPATAAAIVAHRQQHGPFQSVEQLGDVRGIGPAKLDALRGLVTV